ncbi:MAG: HD domain-containing protein [Clostridia bacterium]|nr:HD domain-containing protein [Clostridia bacterium]
MIILQDVKNNEDITVLIQSADRSLCALGFTEHSFAHVGKVGDTAAKILTQLKFPKRDVELVEIAAYLHDIGNMINRVDHSQSGALIAFRLLREMGMEMQEVADIATAIGNHDEGFGVPVSHLAAALILADKSDVRRSRVRNTDITNYDIHDRVNYSVRAAQLVFSDDNKKIILMLDIDTKYSSIMDYFEIFMERMIMCRKAAEYLGLEFKMIINGQKFL